MSHSARHQATTRRLSIVWWINAFNWPTATSASRLGVRKDVACRCGIFPRDFARAPAFARDGRKATAYGLITQTIPVGETAFLLAAPKEQPAPETLRQTDRRRMGLWKAAGASSGARPPTK